MFRLCVLPVVLLTAVAARAETPVEIPFRYGHNLLWIKVNAAGQAEPLDFLFDTGAGTTVLNTDTAGKLGLGFGSAETVREVDSHSAAKWVKGFNANVAGLALPEYLLGIDLSEPGRICKHRIDGLLGADFLKNRAVRIDYAAGKVQFVQHRDTPGAADLVLPLKRRSDGFCVAATIAGKKNQWLRLDTGCDETLRWASREAVAAKGAHRMKAGIELGGRFFNDLDISVQQKPFFPGEDGLLGNAFLSKFTVTIDLTKWILILKPRGT